MPWSTSRRHDRLPADWHKQRARAYRAAGGRCQHHDQHGQRCTWTGPLNGKPGRPGGHADHINRTDPDSPLQWLCPTHHLTKSSREGHQAMRQVRAAAKHPSETHPALRTG